MSNQGDQPRSKVQFECLGSWSERGSIPILVKSDEVLPKTKIDSVNLGVQFAVGVKSDAEDFHVFERNSEMAVFLRTDNHLDGGERLAKFVESVAEGAVEHVKNQVTRVDVYLGDEIGAPESSDHEIRCSMEARIGGLKPFAVTHHAGSIDDAVRGAADKLEASIDSTIGKLSHKKGRISYAGDPDAEIDTAAG